MRKLILYVLAVVLFEINFLHAQEFQSSNFKSLDPVINQGDYSTSSSFQLWSTLSQVAIGTSTITANNSLAGGFLYFPFSSRPTVSATEGDGEVSLTWTPASASRYLGWTVSGYRVGQSITSGSGYSYSSVGSTTSSTRTGLTNETAYYFVIVVEDALGNPIATSSQVTATPTAGVTPPPPPPPPSSGGGGSVIQIPPLTEVSESCPIIPDLNCDSRVNIVDFSIMYYWFDRKPIPKRVDLFLDGKIDLSDFSIMAYYWTD